MKGMLKQILSAVTPIAVAVAAATSPAPPRLSAGGKRKKKNGGGKRIKKRNGAGRFTAINAVKEEDDNKEEAEVRTLAKAAAAIAAAALKAGDIYEDDAWGLVSNWLRKLVLCGGIFFIPSYKSSPLWWNQQLGPYWDVVVKLLY